MSTSGELKSTIYAELGRVGKALGSGPRLELLDLLAQRPCTVEELARMARLSVANTSRHLQVLKRARLLRSHKRGTYVVYELASTEVEQLCLALRRLGQTRLQELAPLTRELGVRPDEVVELDLDALVERMLSDRTTILDVRPVEEFDAAHITGAWSVPLDRLELVVEELPKGGPIVAYCRGPFCLMAHEAVHRLRERGFEVEVYPEGLADWRARGLPISTPQVPPQ